MNVLFRSALALSAPLTAGLCISTASDATSIELVNCRLKGIEREVRCGVIRRAEDPDAVQGRQISIHFAVVPALARNKAPDPVFVFAGGPGQSGLSAAGVIQPAFAQVNARRDIVYVDQRGTGRSNALACETSPSAASPVQQFDFDAAQARLHSCLRRITAESKADLRQYATWIAVRDVDAVRKALGAERVNLWGASYGTRAALEYLRQFPDRVRSAVLDGMAPADMALPASFATDADAMLRALEARCTQDKRCAANHPSLAADIDRLLAGDREKSTARQTIAVRHPLTGAREVVALDRRALAAALRAPLYAPALAAVLPHAVATAAGGDYSALVTLAGTLTGAIADNFAEGMHYAVVCAEDLPRMDAAGRAAARRSRLGDTFVQLYDDACRAIPVRPVPTAFYAVPNADVPVLLLSGGADPATPPRHGAAIAGKLKRARHFVAANLGHGVTAHGCAPELVTKFIRQASFDGLDPGCLDKMPAALFFEPPRAESR